SSRAPLASPALDDILDQALRREATRRFPTALAMAEAIKRATPLAEATEIARWVERLAFDELEQLAEKAVAAERTPLSQKTD
ncbi:hypothetical protein ABTH54_19935, partial [Acinetobacter baumannii]